MLSWGLCVKFPVRWQLSIKELNEDDIINLDCERNHISKRVAWRVYVQQYGLHAILFIEMHFDVLAEGDQNICLWLNIYIYIDSWVNLILFFIFFVFFDFFSLHKIKPKLKEYIELWIECFVGLRYDMFSLLWSAKGVSNRFFLFWLMEM